MKKAIFVLLIAAVLAASMHSSAYAAKTVKELQEEQSALRQKEKDAKEKLGELRSEKNSLTNEVVALDVEIELCESQLAYIHNRLDSTRYTLEVTTSELEAAEEKRVDQYDALRQRLKYIQEYGKIGYVQVLFNSKSFGDFLNRLEYVNDIITYDQNMYTTLEDIEQTISDKKDAVDVQLREIEVLLAEEEDKMLALEQTKEAKELLVKEIEADEGKYTQQLNEFEEESEALAKKIKEAQEEAARAAARAAASSGRRLAGSTGSGVAPNGQYGWPVPGYYSISSGYVNRTSPISGRREFHTGLDIPAPRGTNIVASDAGTVILAGSNGGYGICVVIDHGNGVSTLYGHNSSLVVSVGEYVSRGQTIAKCGSTGMSTGNHCHFEVRINGSPNNPGPYVGI